MNNSKRNIVIIAIVLLLVVGAFAVKKSQEGKSVEKVADTQTDQTELNDQEAKAFDIYNMEGLSLEDLQSYDLPIMLTFGTKNCIYCEQMKPDLARLNTELKGEVIVKYIDMDVYPEFSANWPIQGTPASAYYAGAGDPYKPSEDFANMIYLFKDQKDPSGEHALSMSYGKIPYDTLVEILGELSDQ